MGAFTIETNTLGYSTYPLKIPDNAPETGAGACTKMFCKNVWGQ